MSENEPKKQRKGKYLSVRRALQELKLNEEDLKKMMDKGTVNPIYENDQLKFDEEEIEQLRLSAQINAAQPDAEMVENPAEPIDDEDLYKSSDANYESLFVTRMGASVEQAKKMRSRIERVPEEATQPKQEQAIQQHSDTEQEKAKTEAEATVRKTTASIPLPASMPQDDAEKGQAMSPQPQEINVGRGITKVRQLERNLLKAEDLMSGCVWGEEYKNKLAWLLPRLPFYFWGIIGTLAFLLALNLLFSFWCWSTAGKAETFIRTAQVKDGELDPQLAVEGKMVAADLAQKQLDTRIRQTALNFYIAKGTPVELLLSPLQSKKFLGEVVAITSSVSENTDNVKIAFSGEVNHIPLGKNATIKFILPRKNRCLQVPRESVIFPRHAVSQYQPFVLRAIPHGKHQYRLVTVPVRIGTSNLQFYEITEGVAADERVVVACNFGMDWLSDGMIVSEMR